MKFKTLSLGLSMMMAAIGLSAPSAQSTSAQSITYSCESRESGIALMARPSGEGRSMNQVAVFNWSGLPTTANANQICQSVQGKLQQYASHQEIYGFAVYEINGKPSVCLDQQATDSCTQVLFDSQDINQPNASAAEMGEVLKNILSAQFLPDKNQQSDPTRSFQSCCFRVPLWRILLH
ncbi:MAG: COP23 domain-containing protein [Planktothrix sp.]